MINPYEDAYLTVAEREEESFPVDIPVRDYLTMRMGQTVADLQHRLKPPQATFDRPPLAIGTLIERSAEHHPDVVSKMSRDTDSHIGEKYEGVASAQYPSSYQAEESKFTHFHTFAPARQEYLSDKAELILEDDDVEVLFNLLADLWVERTRFDSSLEDIFGDSAYREILKLGTSVIPHLLRRLQRDPDRWFFALTVVADAQQAVVPDGATREEAVDAWLRWGAEHGYLR